ncbi:hypothetical protein OS493_003011 [Desmophyllum pertusum]|uniref:Uncharacterized protein n=1 Tax=Desmophyllum pertusum TaxID=174260 RepID=A0A9W9YJS7_9CNID|nr:hypothetical protein OS493_003011 [Desmophyllum pertusum]
MIRTAQGLIITSGLPKVYSAGLDLVKEIYKPDKKRLASFWTCFQGMWLRLYGSRLAHHGSYKWACTGRRLCVGFLACDYRVMAEGFRIGMVEIEAGVPPPFWIFSNIGKCYWP